MPLLAIDLIPWIIGLCALSAVVLVLIVVAPSRRIRREPRLSDEVETRLLLGEDPQELDRELAAREEGAAPVAELRPEDGRSGS